MTGPDFNVKEITVGEGEEYKILKKVGAKEHEN